MITTSYNGIRYVRGMRFTRNIVEDDLYAKSPHPLLTELTQRETQMPRWPKLKTKTTKPLKNNPSKVINEVQTTPEAVSNLKAAAPPEHNFMYLSSLCLFFASGRTFTFRDVHVEVDNENQIMFRYKAMSDNRMKTATFSKFHVVGVSRTQY